MILPNSIDIEKSLLGTIIFYPALIPEALEKVCLDAFYDSFNKKIYEKIIDLYDNGITVDNIVLYDKIKPENDEKLEGRLFELGECATSAEIGVYCRIINDKYIRRRIIEQTNMLVKNSLKLDCPIETIVNQLENISYDFTEICSINKIERRERGALVKVNDFKDTVYNYYQNGFDNIGVSTGWKGLDKNYRPAKSTLNIITGIPGHGKSEFIDALMVNISKSKGWKWAVFSPENYPYELHVQKIAEKLTEKSFFKENRMSETDFDNSLKWINEYISFINPSENNLSLDAIIKLAKEAIEKYKIDGLIIDPWNEIETVLREGENETQYIGRSLSKLRRFARNNNIIVYIVSHPAKMYKDKEAKKYNVPTMYDISGSAHWYNKADNGLCIYRDFENDIIDVHVQKIKFKIHGMVGAVSMRYNKTNGCFEETGW